MSVASRIKERRIEMNLSRQELADAVGVTLSAISNYEYGFSVPKTEVMYKLLHVLKCDANYLFQDGMSEEISNNTLSGEDLNLLEKYHQLDVYGKRLINSLLNEAYQRCQEEREKWEKGAKVYKRFYKDPFIRRNGLYIFHELPTDQTLVPASYNHIDYVVRINDDSMEPYFFVGDYAMIKMDEPVNIGDVGIFMVNNVSCIKELGHHCLVSSNQKYKPIRFSSDVEIDCIGKVCGKINNSLFL